LKSDINETLYKQVTDLKSKGLKVSIALGGWLDSEDGNKYSRMINNGTSRSNFVHDTVAFLLRYNFDGLDLDWEYPKCWHANCTAGPVSDKRSFGNLVKELRKAFSYHNFLLSVAVSADRTISNTGSRILECILLQSICFTQACTYLNPSLIMFSAYDIDAFSQNLDWIGIMTYDYHSGANGKTGHHSPYKGRYPNTVDSIQYWTDKGVPPSKLIMGIPLYGRSFTLAEESFHGISAPATPGKPAMYTAEQGYIAFFEFCNGWEYRTEAGVGSYAFKGDQWVSYNDVSIIQQKADYVKQHKLGGAMVWALDLDDFSGEFCGQGKYPLLKALEKGLSLPAA